MNPKIESTIKELENLGLLKNNFKITKELIILYRKIYGKGKESKGNTEINSKLACLNLLKYKRNVLNIKAINIPEGWVYVISNPAWKNCCKIGKTIDSKNRLAQMQTFSPYRDYKIEHYLYSNSALKLEKLAHKTLQEFKLEGEWFNIQPSKALKIIGLLAHVVEQ